MFPALVIAFEFWIEHTPFKLSGELQVLQPIALAMFGAMDKPLPSCMLVQFWKSKFVMMACLT